MILRKLGVTVPELAYLIGCLGIISFVLYFYLMLGFAHAHNDGRYAQTNPAIQKWFNEQLVPGGDHKGGSCCQISDGVNAEERWRNGGYQAKFTITLGGVEKAIPWMNVPPETVLLPPFPRSLLQPIVWWYAESVNGVFNVIIRCYKPEEKGF